MNAATSTSLKLSAERALSSDVPAGRLLRAYLTEARYECVRMLRAPVFAIPFLGMPVLLYLLFAVLIAGEAARKDPAVAAFFFTGFAVFGIIGPGMFGFGIFVATEREQGLLRLKRALPMPAAAYLLAKVLMAMLFAAIIMAALIAAGLTLGHLTLTAGQIVRVAVLGILGAVPFCAMGLWIGTWASSRSAPALVNLIYIPMLHLSGLFYPLPKGLQALAPAWPAYHLQQLAFAAMGAPRNALIHAAVLAGVTVLCGVIALRRLAPEEPAEPVEAASENVVEAPTTAKVTNVAFGNLRAFITLLVLAHHAVLAYHPFAPAPPASLTAEPRWWAAFPIVDSQRWQGFSLLVGFNDVFFMSLMFLLSGLFVWSSLQRKGSGAFLRDRALRLGLPFLVATAVLAPLAYYPAHLQTGADPGFASFWQQWRSLGNWPAGPAWFLWVLLAFDAVVAGLFLLMPRWGDRLGRLAAGARRRPVLFFGLLVTVSAAAYIPMALVFNPFAWTDIGPFFFQTSRILHYAVYFLAGIGIGAYGLQKGLLAPDGGLTRRWFRWLPIALVAFVVVLGMVVTAPSHAGSRGWEIAGGLAFVLSCAASGFAFLALFSRFGKWNGRISDSLRKNAYGMYLLHYAFVSWLQYFLLKAQLSGFTKGALVFAGAVVLSWGATAALRRLPGMARLM